MIGSHTFYDNKNVCILCLIRIRILHIKSLIKRWSHTRFMQKHKILKDLLVVVLYSVSHFFKFFHRFWQPTTHFLVTVTLNQKRKCRLSSTRRLVTIPSSEF